MTITNRIKAELFNADIDYYDALDAFKAEYPNGVNFCYDTISTKAAMLANRLQIAEATYNALAALVTSKRKRSAMENEARRLVGKYNNAETSEELEAIEREYFNLYTLRV